MTVSILTSRLAAAYWPDWCASLRLDDVMRARPIADWAPEGSKRRNTRYDRGRIRFLMEVLESGQAVEPIEVETVWDRGRPVGLEVYDGHHRFMAAVFLGRRRVPAKVGGMVELGEWLTGERRAWPL